MEVTIPKNTEFDGGQDLPPASARSNDLRARELALSLL